MPDTDPSQRVLVELGSERAYPVLFTELAAIPELLPSAHEDARRCLLITDEHVASLYANVVVDALQKADFSSHIITLPPGETTKSINYLRHVYDSALSWGIERTTPVLAFGGGVVGDLGGFAAATLLRGVPLIQVPTTLVAQVDSSIGGKTGVNHPVGKNLIGSFYQPLAVVADTSLLRTLPDREWTSGLAEVVKHGLIADEGLVAFLEAGWADIEARRPDIVAQMVPRAARVKAEVVAQDEREAGLRAVLNFGHTFGHAIEKVAGYGTFTHGEAVAAGMRAALHLSKAVHPQLDAERADELVSRIPVPQGLGALEVSDLMEAMRADKKVTAGRLRVVLLRRIGEAYVTVDVEQSDIEAAWDHVRQVAG